MECRTIEEIEKRCNEDPTYKLTEDLSRLIEEYKNDNKCGNYDIHSFILTSVDSNFYTARIYKGTNNIGSYLTKKNYFLKYCKEILPDYKHIKEFENHNNVKLVLEIINMIKFYKSLDITRSVYERDIHDDLNVIIDYIDGKVISDKQHSILNNHFDLLKRYNAACMILSIKVGRCNVTNDDVDEKTAFFMDVILKYLDEIRDKLHTFEKSKLYYVVYELSRLNNKAYFNKMIQNREIL